MSKAIETILRENVLQAEHVGGNKLGNICMQNTVVMHREQYL